MIDDNPNFPDLPGAAVRQPAAPAQRPDPFPALMANGSLSAAEAPDAQQRSQRAARWVQVLSTFLPSTALASGLHTTLALSQLVWSPVRRRVSCTRVRCLPGNAELIWGSCWEGAEADV